MDHGRVVGRQLGLNQREGDEWEDKDWDGSNAEKDLWKMVKSRSYSQGVVSK